MPVKDDVIAHLKSHVDEYVSGEAMAQELGVSRAAVWKGIQSLQQAGYPITAVRNRGYRLEHGFDILDENAIHASMTKSIAKATTLEVRPKTGSTNNDMRLLASNGAREYSVIVAGQQTNGKGRRGRVFYSLGDIGVYLSILLRPRMEMQESTLITCAAAVAVCRSLEKVCKVHPHIKWVNDVYIGDRKVCGILTEGVSDLETGRLTFAIVGIGVNVYEPEGGFPDEIGKVAGAVMHERQSDLRNKLAASIITEFIKLYKAGNQDAFVAEYRERSFLPGRKIAVMNGSKLGKPATAIAIQDDLSLLVRYDDGSQDSLKSGEVSIRIK